MAEGFFFFAQTTRSDDKVLVLSHGQGRSSEF